MKIQPTKEQLENAIKLLRGGNPKPEDWVVVPKEIIKESRLVNKKGKIKETFYVKETDCGVWDMFGKDD